MTLQALNNDKKELLHVLDPDLPFVASQAAIELDDLISGRDSKPKYVFILEKKLRNSLEIDSSESTHQSLIDPSTLTVLGEAINRSHNQKTVTKVEDLITQARSIADGLSIEKKQKNKKKQLKWVRDFCIALSSLAAGYHKSIFDIRPQHPFRH